MKIQLRKNVFETNSSSVHSICISKNDTYTLPESYRFELKEYGWGPDYENNVGDYLYTALVCLNRTDEINKLKEILERHHVKVEFESYSSDDDYYIDHPDLEELIEYLFKDENENTLLSFLFGNNSMVLIYNDNGDYPRIQELRKKFKEDNSNIVFDKWN